MLDIVNYADVNSPFAYGESIPSVTSQIERGAVVLLKWIRNNGQKANPGKFHLILSYSGQTHSVKIDKFNIESSNCKKLLGIKIDSKLNFDEHDFMTLEQRKVVMKSFIMSQFGYCPLVWMFHSRTLNNRINCIHEYSPPHCL